LSYTRAEGAIATGAGVRSNEYRRIPICNASWSEVASI